MESLEFPGDKPQDYVRAGRSSCRAMIFLGINPRTTRERGVFIGFGDRLVERWLVRDGSDASGYDGLQALENYA